MNLARTLSFVLALPLLSACSKPESAPAKDAAASAKPADAKETGDAMEGKAAPDLTLSLEDGTTTKLSALKGKTVVLFFYPKDETSGCTIEAQGMRDSHEDLTKAGVVVFGVSTQDAASHKAFIAKEKLPYHLVVDDKEEVAKAFGVPVRVGFASRQTIIVGPDGKVKKVFRNVSPKGHSDEVLKAAKS